MGPSAWFGRQTVQSKARVIAAVCAVAGVLMGFIVYIVFAHTFEKGEVLTRILALGVGLIVAMGVARLGEWLWETIATGEAEVHGQGKKAFSTAVFLIVVFELCASTVEDFAKIAIGGEFETIQRIASRVAGTDETQNRVNADSTDLPALLERLRAYARAAGLPAAWSGNPATTPEARLIQSMSLADRLTILGGAVEPTPAQLDVLFAESPRRMGLLAQFDRFRLVPAAECAPELLAMSPGIGGRSLEQILSDDPEKRALWDRTVQERIAARNAACADALAKIGQEVRIERMIWAVNVALGRHDFYAREAFTNATPKSLTAATPRETIRSANLSLLREAFPEIVKPAPVLWGSFATLIVVWCAAAVALSLFLTQGVFEIPARGGLVDRLVPSIKAAAMALGAAAVAMGLAILAIRMTGYIGDLMFGEVPPLMNLPGIAGVLNLVPWAVRELSQLEVFGMHLPAWLILPTVIAALAWLAARGPDDKDSPFPVLAVWALAGIVIMSVLPVLPGVLGLMLIVAVTWVVPAFGLAVLLPYLEPGAKVPRLWGLIALGVGMGLGIWAAMRFATTDPLSEAVLIATAVFLIATGTLVFREIAVKDLWPLLTVTVAFCLVGGTSVWQDATFKGALNQLHPLVERKANQEPAMFDYVVYGVPKVDAAVEPEPESVALPEPDDGVNEAARLELALVGSLGFWLTIALLAAWSLRRKHEALAQTPPPV